MTVFFKPYKNMLDTPSPYIHTIENLRDGVVFTDSNGCVAFVNRAMEMLTGYRSTELLGNAELDSLLSLKPVETSRDVVNLSFLDAVHADRKSGEDLFWLVAKKGERIPVLRSIDSLDDRNKKTAGTIQVYRDCRLLYELHGRLHELERRVSIDYLTQLPNRSYIDMNIRSRLFEFRRNGWPFGVIVIDIDHFKRFNDEHGHDVGDAVLKQVASVLAKHSRPYDVIGRWGGEEFVGVAANVDKLGLYSWAERLRFLVQKSSLKKDRKILRVTVSIGASIVRVGDDEEMLIKRADENLYLSKQNGRNRTTVDSI